VQKPKYFQFHSRKGWGITLCVPISLLHPDGAKSPTNLPRLGKVVSPTEDAADWQRKGFLMITRRDYLIGISAVLVSTPAIVRPQSLMKIRGIIMPLHQNYYGFCDRLGIDFRYRSGELRGPGLITMIDQGLLRHIPPTTIAYDLARWGTAELSQASRRERSLSLWSQAKLADF
jgi:hypothetical protein